MYNVCVHHTAHVCHANFPLLLHLFPFFGCRVRDPFLVFAEQTHSQRHARLVQPGDQRLSHCVRRGHDPSTPDRQSIPVQRQAQACLAQHLRGTFVAGVACFYTFDYCLHYHRVLFVGPPDGSRDEETVVLHPLRRPLKPAIKPSILRARQYKEKAAYS